MGTQANGPNGDVLSSPMVSDPYKRLDCCLISDGAAAVIIARDTDAPPSTRPRTRIIGLDSATDPVRLGDRAEPEWFEAKARAAAQAYRMTACSEAKPLPLTVMTVSGRPSRPAEHAVAVRDQRVGSSSPASAQLSLSRADEVSCRSAMRSAI